MNHPAVVAQHARRGTIDLADPGRRLIADGAWAAVAATPPSESAQIVAQPAGTPPGASGT